MEIEAGRSPLRGEELTCELMPGCVACADAPEVAVQLARRDQLRERQLMDPRVCEDRVCHLLGDVVHEVAR